MAKYIDADKLKTEIERLRSEAEYEKYESFGNHDGFIINEAKEYICMLLKSFIDSLQQEQPEVDLEEEILNQWEDYPHDKWPKCPYHDFTNIARHFYELGKNSK